MTVEDNKALVRRFIEQIFVAGRLDAVDQLVAEDFEAHTWGKASGRDGLKAAMQRMARGLADAAFTIDDLIGEGDRVAVRLTATAKQVGEFMGLPPSGKSYTIGEIHIFRVRDGKVVEHWHQFDQMSLMQQLGAMPGKTG
jgi:steroid delta-isomerase-like uncharacterized protein